MGCSSLTDKEYHLPSLKEKVLKFLGIYICLENLDITSELLMCSSFYISTWIRTTINRSMKQPGIKSIRAE